MLATAGILCGGSSAILPPDGPGYRSRLMNLAGEEKAAFLDMHGAWGRYILDSKWTCGSFMRDGIHANDRGKQILAASLKNILRRLRVRRPPGKSL